MENQNAKLIFETDWLASETIFFHEKTGKYSANINEVINFADFGWHPEGINNYLDSGFSTHGQTAVNHVKYLLPEQRLWQLPDGSFKVEQLPESFDAWAGKTTHEDDAWHLTEKHMNRWEDATSGTMVIPTSGGFDSRLLNFFMKDRSRISSFSYGVSPNQAENYNVVNARKLSELLGTKWQHVSLGNYLQYLDDWYQLYGISTHAHGMSHFEFYNVVKATEPDAKFLLSGLIGDAWAGDVKPPVINSAAEDRKLSYPHNTWVDTKYSQIATDYALRKQYHSEKKEKLQDPRYAIYVAMGRKLLLLNYLLRLPRLYGMEPYAPFIELDLAMTMLFLPDERRKGRQWQRDFMKRNGIYIEDYHLKSSSINTLNQQAMMRGPMPPLSASLLKEVVKPEIVEFTNANLLNNFRTITKFKVNTWLRHRRYIWKYVPRDQSDMAYCAYRVLYPIQKLIEQRNAALSK